MPHLNLNPVHAPTHTKFIFSVEKKGNVVRGETGISCRETPRAVLNPGHFQLPLVKKDDGIPGEKDVGGYGDCKLDIRRWS